MTELSESDVYEIDESEYVRKADVDEYRKESRLQGLKEQLASSDTGETAQLCDEIENIEARIDELTEFKPGSRYHTRSSSESPPVNTSSTVIGAIRPSRYYRIAFRPLSTNRRYHSIDRDPHLRRH